MHSFGPLHRAEQKQDDQLEHTYSSYLRIRDVALKTCQGLSIIGRSGERGSGISVLAARHDDDDDDDESICSHQAVGKLLNRRYSKALKRQPVYKSKKEEIITRQFNQGVSILYNRNSILTENKTNKIL